jgi:hypothetical protein
LGYERVVELFFVSDAAEEKAHSEDLGRSVRGMKGGGLRRDIRRDARGNWGKRNGKGVEGKWRGNDAESEGEWEKRRMR